MDLSISRKWPGKNFTSVEGSITVSSSTCKHTQQGSLEDFFHKAKRLVLKWSKLTSHTYDSGWVKTMQLQPKHSCFEHRNKTFIEHFISRTINHGQISIFIKGLGALLFFFLNRILPCLSLWQNRQQILITFFTLFFVHLRMFSEWCQEWWGMSLIPVL